MMKSPRGMKNHILIRKSTCTWHYRGTVPNPTTDIYLLQFSLLLSSTLLHFFFIKNNKKGVCVLIAFVLDRF